MSRSLLFVAIVLGLSRIAAAQEACTMIGEKNTMGMTMTVSKVWVSDSTNFMVSSMKSLPCTFKTTDSMWFDLCTFASDGKSHTSQLHCMTDMGTMSYNIAMTAPMASMKVVSEMNPHPMNITISKVWVDDSADFYVLPPQTLPYVVPNGGIVSFNLYLKTLDGTKHTAKISFSTDMGTFTTNATTMSSSAASVANDPQDPNGLQVFPNPVASTLNITSTSNGIIELVSMNSQVVYRGNHLDNTTQVPVTGLPNGDYILRMTPESRSPIEKKIIIAR